MFRFLNAARAGVLLLVAAPAASPAQAPPSISWTASVPHCRAEFTVSHMVVSKVWGHIPIRQLTLVTTAGSAIPQRIDAVLDPSHLDTDNHDRDADLRGPTYFDVEQYPTMTFTSTSIVPKSPTSFDVTGKLTIKNVTKPVTFPVDVEGIIPDAAGRRIGYSGHVQIDRRDWGIVDQRLTPAGVLLVGYSVDIGLTVEVTGNDPSLHPST